MHSKKRNKLSTKIWLIIAALIIIPAILIAIYRIACKSEFDRRVDALSAAGYPVSVEELMEQYALDEGVENAAEYYALAFQRKQQASPEESPFLPMSGSYVPNGDEPPYPQEVIDALKSYLERNQTTLELLDQAARTEHCAWPRTKEGFWLINDYLSEIGRTAQLLTERNIYLVQTAEPDEVYKAMLTMIGMSKSMSRQAFLLDHLIGMSMKALSIRSLNTVLSQVDFTEEQLEVLQNHFATMNEYEALHRIMIVERCFSIGFWNMTPQEQLKNSFRNKSKVVHFLYSASGVKQQDALLSLDYMKKNIEAAKLPTHERSAEFEKIQNEIDMDILSFMRLYLYETTMIPSNANTLDLRLIANLKCAETALALERYRKKYHKLPYSLDSLVPKFMDTIPHDPYDNEILRYIRTSKGYTLYTVGENITDDGGIPRDQARKKFGKDTSQYDYTFTVKWK